MINYFKRISISFIFLIYLLFSFSFSKEYVLLVSFDGFRYDYADKVSTPNFDINNSWITRGDGDGPINL